MNIAATDSKPWYKQFWPWFVIGIPACSVVMGLTLLYVATQNEVSIVKEDWYKDGLAINQRIDKQLKAKEMGLSANIDFSRETGALTVSIPKLKDTPTGLLFTLVHPTSESGDESLQLTITPDQTYWAKLEPTKKGFFYLQIQDETNQWQLDGAINFNNEQVSINLTAE